MYDDATKKKKVKKTNLLRAMIAAYLFLTFAFTSVSFASEPSIRATPLVEKLLSEMTLNEKVALLGGTGFATRANDRLNIPALEMTDGPVGIRYGQNVTAWPAAIALGSTFDPELINKLGVALGEEARSQNKRMLLGPTVNITRTTWGGRVFESYGEDPKLNAALAAAYIKGVQSQDVITSIKHFAVNNQEWGRGSVDVHVSERALREIYWPAFKAGVDAGSLSVMAAYNKINGVYCSENSHLLQDILKKEFGFTGFVISDWGATHSTVDAALNGLDLEMPVSKYFSFNLVEAVQKQYVANSVVDDKVRRILTAMATIGLIGTKAQTATPAIRYSNHHPELALEVAQKSLVLLKNQNHILPLSNKKKMTLALVGPSVTRARTGGGGSSLVHNSVAVSAAVGIAQRLKEWNAPVELVIDDRLRLPGDPIDDSKSVSKPFIGEYFDNPILSGAPTHIQETTKLDFDWEWGTPDSSISGSNGFSARWTGELAATETGVYELWLAFAPAARVFLDDKIIYEHWNINDNQTPLVEARLPVSLKAHQNYKIRIEYYHLDGLANIQLVVRAPSELQSANLLASAARTAAAADFALVFVGQSAKTESESFDRTSIRLSEEQEKLILKTAAANPQTIVVVQAGSPIDVTPWASKVAAIVYAWYPGEQGGLAIADALFGATNFEGHLPISFPKTWADSPAAALYPGAAGIAQFADDIFVGYRAYDRAPQHLQYRFGYGLSYSEFSAHIAEVDFDSTTENPSAAVTVVVKNKSARAGRFLVQLYVSSVNQKNIRPEKELREFKNISLAAGETKSVTLDLGREAFQFYNEAAKKWQVNSGYYTLSVLNNDTSVADSTTILLKP